MRIGYLWLPHLSVQTAGLRYPALRGRPLIVGGDGQGNGRVVDASAECLTAGVRVGMTPRGEVGLIVALIGLQMNMISPKAYAIVIFMTATTTLFARPILRWLFRKPQSPTQTLPSGTHAEVINDPRAGIADAAREGIEPNSE